MAISAIPHHTAASSKGDPSDFAIAAGVRKMPNAIDCPVTTATAEANPICLPSFVCAGSSFRMPSYAERHDAGIPQKFEGWIVTGKTYSYHSASIGFRFAALIAGII